MSTRIFSIKDGDWNSVRTAIQRLASQKLGTDTTPLFKNIFLDDITQGSVLFAGANGEVSQDNSSLFWDDTNNRLGIGTTTPNNKIQVEGLIQFDDTNYNTLLGTDAFANDTGQYNIGLGYQTGYYNDTTGAGDEGDYNTYIGYLSGYGATGGSNNTGKYNLGIGYQTLYDNTSGYHCSALGYWALANNTIGIQNVAVGSYALGLNQSGSYNVAIGANALYKNSGSNNFGMGYSAGYDSTGIRNTYIGYRAGAEQGAGNDNVIIGQDAGLGVNGSSVYSSNLIVGSYAGLSLTTGSNNIFLGYKSGYNQTTNSNLLIIDNQDRGSAANEATNCLIYGTFNATPADQTLKVNADVEITYNIELGHATDTTIARKSAGIIEVEGEEVAFVDRHYASMDSYESGNTETVGQTDQYYAVQGEHTQGEVDGWTMVAGSSGAGNITTADGGAAININDTAHGLVTGDYVNVQSANHSGTSVVTYVDDDNFTVAIAYVGDEACTWQEGDYLLAGANEAGKYLLNFGLTCSAGAASKNYKFEAVQNATHLDNSAFEITTQGTNHQSGSSACIITVAASDRIWIQFKNETDAQDLNYEHSHLVLTRL